MRARRFLLSATAALLAVGGAGAAGADTPPYGTASDNTPAPCAAGTTGCPNGDAFYTAPVDLSSLAPGALIRSRASAIAQPGVQAASATTVAYRSADSFDAPVLGVATVLVPSAPWTGTGARPLVSFQFAEDSLGRQCAPSYALQHQGVNAIVSAESPVVQTLLTSGYVVVVPDAEGPAEQFIAGRQEGHAVLDGLRAAIAQGSGGVVATSPVGLVGYSGGAHATAWAAELAGGYAPELKVAGVVEGGTPADLAVTAKYNEGAASSGLVLFAALGLGRAYPGAGILQALNSAGQSAAASAGTQCVNGIFSYAGKRLDDYTTQPDLIDTPVFQRLLADNRLGRTAPSFPIFNYHAVPDEIVPYPPDKVLVDTYCRAGVHVTHLELPAADHLSGEEEGVGPGLTWLDGRFNGAPITDTCAVTNAEPVPPLLPTVAAPAGGSSPTPAVPEAPAAAVLLIGAMAAAAGAGWRRRRSA